MTDLFLLSERQMARIKVAGSASCSSSLQARSMIANISVDEAPLVRAPRTRAHCTIIRHQPLSPKSVFKNHTIQVVKRRDFPCSECA